MYIKIKPEIVVYVCISAIGNYRLCVIPWNWHESNCRDLLKTGFEFYYRLILPFKRKLIFILQNEEKAYKFNSINFLCKYILFISQTGKTDSYIHIAIQGWGHTHKHTVSHIWNYFIINQKRTRNCSKKCNLKLYVIVVLVDKDPFRICFTI